MRSAKEIEGELKTVIDGKILQIYQDIDEYSRKI